jgi:hypothetical protein
MSEQEISVLSLLADAAGTQYCIPKSRAALDLVTMLLSVPRNARKRSDLP